MQQKAPANIGITGFLVFITGLILLACEPEQEKFTFDPSASLRFSSDSVKFDTVFTSIGSITKRLKVYNDSRNAVNISSIILQSGNLSPFDIVVNGVNASKHENIRLLGKDSLLVLVEVLIDPEDEDLPFLVTDQIEFLTNGNNQNVPLVAYGQDAVFLNGEVLACNTTWTANRPYVIYNSVLVDSLCKLTIEPGARIYSHNASFIFVQGSLEAAGTAESPILFSNDRFEENFINAPGQWGGIIMLEGSKDHVIDHARIRNAQVGIYLGTPDDDANPDLVVSNSIIENIGGGEALPTGDFQVLPGFGLIAFNSDLYAYNVLINNCEIQTIGNYAGGNYRYEHCTLANFSFQFFRQSPSVLFADNLILDDNSLLQFPLNVSLLNSIVWGSLSDELTISITNEATAQIDIRDNLIRTLEFRDALGDVNLINADPFFADPRLYDYQLDDGSPAIDRGSDIGIPTDLTGTPRDADPDLGAYEKIK
ncbi:choice-of-anchor Q domain-containing protein [Fulvivirga sedimenti]|uniref:Right-handed parallel beta-helix repeat-containing protein n=1 Tax=Fulvivirga sedimenti TaxID=2879465 RepID=A0A9X1HUC1_9BACT|nr:choice-of-anchor Q domain-containing protein [Fulvivirga sedimenti]MCA6078448.1 right-handed parallel beta-helix repeat-containing protein [Fulvivirga sedimenti]